MTIGPNCGTDRAQGVYEVWRLASCAAPGQDRAAGDFGRGADGVDSCRSAQALVDWRRCDRGADWSPDRQGHASCAETSFWMCFVATRGLWGGRAGLASAICRHHWPLALLAAICRAAVGGVVLIAAVVDGGGLAAAGRAPTMMLNRLGQDPRSASAGLGYGAGL